MNLQDLRLSALVFSLLLFLPPPSVAETATSTCELCNNFSGEWTCESVLFAGGSSCKVAGETCSVSGSCGSSGRFLPVRVYSSQIRQIAVSHPRVAATALLFTSEPLTSSVGQVFWHNSELTTSDVDDLIQGRPMGLQPTPGEAVIYAVTVQQLTPVNGQARAVLRVSPVISSPLDPSFIELSMLFTRGGDPNYTDLYVVTSWHLE
jgi:hypothetical protein